MAGCGCQMLQGVFRHEQVFIAQMAAFDPKRTPNTTVQRQRNAVRCNRLLHTTGCSGEFASPLPLLARILAKPQIPCILHKVWRGLHD